MWEIVKVLLGEEKNVENISCAKNYFKVLSRFWTNELLIKILKQCLDMTMWRVQIFLVVF